MDTCTRPADLPLTAQRTNTSQRTEDKSIWIKGIIVYSPPPPATFLPILRFPPAGEQISA